MEKHCNGGRYADHNNAMDTRATISEVSNMPYSSDAREIGRALAISPQQVTRLAKAGKIPAFKVGGVWRFPTKKITAMLNDEEHFPTEKPAMVCGD